MAIKTNEENDWILVVICRFRLQKLKYNNSRWEEREDLKMTVIPENVSWYNTEYMEESTLESSWGQGGYSCKGQVISRAEEGGE